MLLWLLTMAWADEPTTMPQGAASVYTGLGGSSFRRLNDGVRDRSVKVRADLYGAYAVHDRLQLSLSAPLLYGTVIDDPDQQPCPNLLTAESYCVPYLTVGSARLDARTPLVRGPFRLAVGLGLGGDPWNRSKRGRYTSPGTGTPALSPYVLTGPRIPLGDKAALSVTAGGGFVWSLAPDATSSGGEITVKAPGDAVQVLGEVRAELPGPVSLQTGVYYDHRLTGVPLGGSWQQDWFSSSLDRWNVLQTQLLRGSGKVSVDLPKSMGLHLGVTWLYEVQEGPTDLFDVSLGWHKYFAPKGS